MYVFDSMHSFIIGEPCVRTLQLQKQMKNKKVLIIARHIQKLHKLRSTKAMYLQMFRAYELGPTQVKCWLINYDIFLNEFLTFSWKCHKSNSDIQFKNMS